MLRIAVPNKGSLSETAAQMLSEAGYHGRRDPKELIVADPRNGVEFFYLRPRDIATYVGSGALDVGITGRAGFKSLEENQRVSFVTANAPKGPQATKIQVL